MTKVSSHLKQLKFPLYTLVCRGKKSQQFSKGNSTLKTCISFIGRASLDFEDEDVVSFSDGKNGHDQGLSTWWKAFTQYVSILSEFEKYRATSRLLYPNHGTIRDVCVGPGLATRPQRGCYPTSTTGKRGKYLQTWLMSTYAEPSDPRSRQPLNRPTSPLSFVSVGIQGSVALPAALANTPVFGAENVTSQKIIKTRPRHRARFAFTPKGASPSGSPWPPLFSTCLPRILQSWLGWDLLSHYLDYILVVPDSPSLGATIQTLTTDYIEVRLQKHPRDSPPSPWLRGGYQSIFLSCSTHWPKSATLPGTLSKSSLTLLEAQSLAGFLGFCAPAAEFFFGPYGPSSRPSPNTA
jgi:hypothetical protein